MIFDIFKNKKEVGEMQPIGKPKYKRGDLIYVTEHNNGNIEIAEIISEPEWREVFSKVGWWYKVMTESRFESEKTECIYSGGKTRRPQPNELFQWYMEINGELGHGQFI